MFSLSREHAFLEFYILKKEYYYTDYVRDAINTIDYLMRRKGDKQSIAISKTINKIRKKYKVELEVEFLRKAFRQRKAHVKNGKEEFKKFTAEMRKAKKPNIELPILCACGCGQPVKKGNKFINGHNAKCRSKNEDKKLAKNMREKRAKKTKHNVIIIEDYVSS